MSRKRGIIETPDWKHDENIDTKPIEDDNSNLAKSDPGEDFLQMFLREQREKGNVKSFEESTLHKEDDKPLNNETKSIYELAVEEMQKEQEAVEDESGIGNKLLDKFKNISEKVVPAIKDFGGAVVSAGNNIKKNNQKKLKTETPNGDMELISTVESEDNKTIPFETSKTYSGIENSAPNIIEPAPNPVPTTKKIIGVSDLVFLGTGSGTGTTYSSFLCASTLSKSYKTCVLELNKSGHFSEIFEYLNQEPPGNRKMYRYDGVDYYFNINYNDFLSEFRNKYDFVIIDMGNMSKIDDYTQVMLSSNVFVIAHGDEWRLKQLKMSYDKLSAKDKTHSWIYMITLKEINKDIKKIVRNNKVFTLPYSPSSYKPTPQIIELFNELLDLNIKAKK